MNKKIEHIVGKTIDVSTTIEQNVRKTIKSVTEKYFLTYIDNILS